MAVRWTAEAQAATADQADSDGPRELTFVPEEAIWAKAEAFARDPTDDWYRQPIVGISLREMCPVSRSETTTVRPQPADNEPREVTFARFRNPRSPRSQTKVHI